MPQDEAVLDADAALGAVVKLPSPRRPLDRDRIVGTAVAIIDETGLVGLTMGRVGSVLDVGAMALYRYVAGREDLLDAVVDSLLAEMGLDKLLASPRDGWQDFLRRIAHGVRRVALAHPKAFSLIAFRPVDAPWLRSPLRSVRWVETFLDGLIDEGFSDTAAVRAYRAFTSFLLGHLLLEVLPLGADEGPHRVLKDREDRNEKSRVFPTTERFTDVLAEDHCAIAFEQALDDLLNRIALTRIVHG